VLLCLLLGLSPVGVVFVEGVWSYLAGAPALRFVGLPRLESFNLDRSSRCFKSGGGCVLSGNEWAFIFPYNAALRLMSLVCGPPSKSYDGPYPTKEEALHMVSDATATPMSVFQQGTVIADGETIPLGTNLVSRLVAGLQLFLPEYPGNSEFEIGVRAKIYESRCVIIRLSEHNPLFNSDATLNKDFLVFFDKKNRRPFAYFTIAGRGVLRFQPVKYLSDQDRCVKPEGSGSRMSANGRGLGKIRSPNTWYPMENGVSSANGRANLLQPSVHGTAGVGSDFSPTLFSVRTW
jgi:hypothetical protein